MGQDGHGERFNVVRHHVVPVLQERARLGRFAQRDGAARADADLDGLGRARRLDDRQKIIIDQRRHMDLTHLLHPLQKLRGR